MYFVPKKSFLISIVFFFLTACDNNNSQKVVPHDLGTSSPNKKASQKNDTPEDLVFKEHVINFLEALKTENVAEASKYSTSSGLETFLRFDIDSVTDYSIRDFKSDKKNGTAKVKLEGIQNEMTFYFKKQKGRWVFIDDGKQNQRSIPQRTTSLYKYPPL